jgi:exosome complex RNA-binding protein Rrp42 (RNase PH superfamily)
MSKNDTKKVQTDADVKKKAVKMVITHLKKKIGQPYVGKQNMDDWIIEMETLLSKQEFDIGEYFEMRKKLNDIIERTIDEEMRYKLRDSWYSLGKALDKKVKHK